MKTNVATEKLLTGDREGSASSAAVRASCAIAFLIGALVVFIVGFSHMDVVHNAAHDTRHSLSFPCH